jgi:hypothetical protein
MPATEDERQIAGWMLSKYLQFNRLVQTVAAREIRIQFGEQHVHKNANRNWAINKPILEEFRKLTPEDVVWSRSTQTWRKRRPTDPPDSRMVR